jgi:hypothetical protein
MAERRLSVLSFGQAGAGQPYGRALICCPMNQGSSCLFSAKSSAAELTQ